MTLLTPTNLKYIIKVSLVSRLLVFIIQLISNLIIEDHVPDAYINRYSFTLDKDNCTFELLSPNYKYVYKTIAGFTRWDSQYFLEISNDGYVSEPHLAFLPLFPLAIALGRKVISKDIGLHSDYVLLTTSPLNVSDLSTESLENYIKSATIGYLFNNFLFFPIACLALFSLTKLIKAKDDKYARDVLWWFCFNPASIFFSTNYTESLFAALTFSSMFIIELRSYQYLQKHQEFDKKNYMWPLSQLDRLVYLTLPSLSTLAMSTATRSNGLVTIGFLAYQFQLKYMALLKQDRSSWSFMIYLSLVFEFFQDILVLFMGAVIAASGYITFQVWSYLKFCIKPPASEKGNLVYRPSWCDNPIPHPYGQVQAKYWNVGPFQYYKLKQLPNFFLAFPVSYLILTYSLQKSKELGRSIQSKKQLAYYIQGILLIVSCGISINVQVITRLVASSCPVLYWICVDASRQSRIASFVLKVYFLSYFVIGTILHTNFYPWT